MIGDKRALQAWQEALPWSEALDARVEPLCASAELMRDISEPSGIGTDRTPLLLPLVADISGIPKRTAWAAWNDAPKPKPVSGMVTLEDIEAQPEPTAPTRGGKWTRLCRDGAILGAVDDPVGMPLYSAPRPLRLRPAMRPGARKPALEVFDPNEESSEEQPPRRQGPLARLAAFRRRHNITDEAAPPTEDVLRSFADTDKDWGATP